MYETNRPENKAPASKWRFQRSWFATDLGTASRFSLKMPAICTANGGRILRLLLSHTIRNYIIVEYQIFAFAIFRCFPCVTCRVGSPAATAAAGCEAECVATIFRTQPVIRRFLLGTKRYRVNDRRFRVQGCVFLCTRTHNISSVIYSFCTSLSSS